MNNQNTLTLSSDVCFKTKAITTSISSQSSQEVIFPDSNLASRLRVALNINDGEPITQAKLDTLIQFVAENANIESIEGLGAATNLKQLALNKNKIKDITPLNGLNNLQELYLEGNYISDLSGLGDLPSLFYLAINNNQIVNISPVNALTGLTTLGADNNQISDISSLYSLVNIKQFSFVSNNITDISVITNYPDLYGVYFSDNPITDLEPLRNRTALQIAVLARIGHSDFSVLQDRAYLGRVDISGNDVKDLSFLVKSKDFIVQLVAESNDIMDLSPLTNAAHLQILALYNNPNLTDISPLQDCPELKQFFIPNTGVTDISKLSTSIVTLSTANNAIADYSPLINLPNLYEFFGMNSGITDPSFLNGHQLLSFVHLNYNQISNLSVMIQPLPSSIEVNNQDIVLVERHAGSPTELSLYCVDGSVPEITWVTPGHYNPVDGTVTWDNAGENKLTWTMPDGANYLFSGTLTQTVV